jgi:myo-inositol 2-dehydrogenase/D-chiro-inositol 1-dehydrogenase
MGRQHALNIDEAVAGASLAAVMDVDLDRCAPISEATGCVVFDDANALIASDAVDAVVIASPDATHAELALRCIEHSKPALVEKPLADEVADAAAVVEREMSGQQRLLQVGFVRHYDADHLAVRDAVRGGAIGRPLLFRGWHRNPPEATPPSSVEVVVGSAIHDLDSARWFLSQEIIEVNARGTVIHPDITDQLHLQIITLVMSGGGLGVIEVNKDAALGYEVGVEIIGSAGLVSSLPHEIPEAKGDGQGAQAPDWSAWFADAYLAEIQAWSRSAAKGTAEGPSAWDGYRSLAAATAAVESLQRGVPVTIDDPPIPAFYAS